MGPLLRVLVQSIVDSGDLVFDLRDHLYTIDFYDSILTSNSFNKLFLTLQFLNFFGIVPDVAIYTYLYLNCV